MENNFNEDNFEEFLQNQLQNHKMFPKDSVWREISIKLHGEKRWPALTFASFLLISVTTFICLHFSSAVLIFLGVLTLAITFLSGAYPALILSGFKPITALKGKISTRQVGGISTRRGLVVVQFFITQLLIICTIVVAQQMDFSKNMDLINTSISNRFSI